MIARRFCYCNYALRQLMSCVYLNVMVDYKLIIFNKRLYCV